MLIYTWINRNKNIDIYIQYSTVHYSSISRQTLIRHESNIHLIQRLVSAELVCAVIIPLSAECAVKPQLLTDIRLSSRNTKSNFDQKINCCTTKAVTGMNEAEIARHKWVNLSDSLIRPIASRTWQCGVLGTSWFLGKAPSPP